MKHWKLVCTMTLLAVGSLAVSGAQVASPGGFDLNWFTIDSGGGASLSGSPAFQMTSTIGQPDAAPAMTGGGFAFTGGFWPGVKPINPCPPDIVPPGGNGIVNVDDLLAVINGWGPCPAPPASCIADIAPQPGGNGVVNVDDLLAVINGWGTCP